MKHKGNDFFKELTLKTLFWRGGTKFSQAASRAKHINPVRSVNSVYNQRHELKNRLRAAGQENFRYAASQNLYNHGAQNRCNKAQGQRFFKELNFCLFRNNIFYKIFPAVKVHLARRDEKFTDNINSRRVALKNPLPKRSKSLFRYAVAKIH